MIHAESDGDIARDTDKASDQSSAHGSLLALRGLLDRPLYCFCGLAFIEAWTQLLYSSGVLILPPGALPSLPIAHLFSTLAVILASLIVALAAFRLMPLRLRRALLWSFSFVGALSTAGVSLASSGIIASEWAIVSIIGTATSGSFISLAYVELFATQSARGALACYAASIVGGVILSLLSSFLPQMAGVCLTVILPLAAVASLRPQHDDQKAAPMSVYRSFTAQLAASPWRLILIVGITAFAYGAVNTLYLPSDLSDGVSMHYLDWLVTLGAGLVALMIACLVAFYSYRVNASVAFYVALPVIAVASLLLALPLTLPRALLLTVTSVGVDLIRLLVWLLLIDTVRQRTVPALLCFGLLSCTQFLGTFLGQILAVITLTFATSPLIVSFGLLVTLLVAALLALGARTQLASPTVAEPAGIDRTRRLTQAYRLSPRESEVCSIWLAGHTGGYIERTLCISRHTVKTHLNHIYAKTGTANREELLELLEQNDRF